MRPILLAAASALLTLSLLGTGLASEPTLQGHLDYNAHRQQLEAIAKSHLVELKSLAKTHGGRDVWLLTIGTGKRDEKPAILIMGSVHAPHLVGGELAVQLARRLVEKAGVEKSVREMLQRYTFYVIPRPSPDASEAFFERPFRERTRNARPIDDDGDGRVDEDPPEDLNGDGLITMLRVEDAAGAYLTHPTDGRVVIKAEPKENQRGRYSLYVEGRDRDHDEQIAEDPPGGVALDRNFTFRYPYYEPGAGPNQVSEAETRAVADFAFGHPNIALVLTFTPEDNLVDPWKPDLASESQRVKTNLLSADSPYFNRVAEEYRKLLGIEGTREAPEGAGAFHQWAYFHFGRWSFACRGWWIPQVKAEPDTAKKDKSEVKQGAEELNALRWFAQQKIDGFVDWKPISHPDFSGRSVEVGGFRPFVTLNPPAAQLEPLANTHWRLLEQLVAWMPRLTIDSAKAEPLGGNVWRVSAVVVNRGMLPTMSEMGRITGQPHPLQIQLVMPKDVSLATGYTRVQLKPLAGEGGRVEQTWLVLGSKAAVETLQVRVWSPSVGDETRAVVPTP
jgi:hypothetical protein